MVYSNPLSPQVGAGVPDGSKTRRQVTNISHAF
jgi:hypothetical protein